MPSKATAALDNPETAVVTVTDEGMVSQDRIAELLRVVPTFTIVDKKGVPFMVVGEDAKVTGYFFTEYDECKRVLDLARTSADKAIEEGKKDPRQAGNEELVNPWNEARISTVPLDFAVTLVAKTFFGNGLTRGNYFQVAPSEADIGNALAITGKDDLAEGKVPLFYIEDFELPAAKTTSKTTSSLAPLYFSKKQLERAYQAQTKASPPSEKIKVTELFAVLFEMARPDGTDPNLLKLIFVAPPNSDKQAKECQKKGGNEPPFLLGQRNVVL